MLILARKLNESVVIDGRIIVKVVRVDGEVIRLGIQAPADVPVHRQEIYDEIQRNNQQAINEGRPALPKLTPVAADFHPSSEQTGGTPPGRESNPVDKPKRTRVK